MPAIHSALAPWSVSVPVTLALLLSIWVYLRGWLRLRSTIPNVISAWQLSAFMSGVFALWIALGSPLRALHHELLSFHMVDHVLLMAVAPPLILLGALFRSFKHGLPRWFLRERLARFLRLPTVQRLGHALGHPMFCWIAATAALIGWHVPAAFELGMRSDRWHEIEYACFFGTGLLFWLPVIQPWPIVVRWPRWSIVLYLFFGTLPCDALSAFLTFCDRVVYPGYLAANWHFGISPLQDQECAGALMWVCVTFIYLVPAVVITMQLLSTPNAYDPNPVRADLPQITARPAARPEVEVVH
ncbi:MAG TPA: cytochrome c oxidase assembly protein [Candidatus Dormibacteraeota bacterium]|nr:cytochrome c oxidase assembly protein [Candidatus Dormibacteraeota bacterium]